MHLVDCKRQLNIWRSRMENKQPVCDPVCPAKTDFTAVPSSQMTKPNCIFCSKDIQPDDLTQFSHGNSHNDCFKCSTCSRQLNIWKYRLTQGKLYCDPQCPKSTHETSKCTSSPVEIMTSILPDINEIYQCPLHAWRSFALKKNSSASNKTIGSGLFDKTCLVLEVQRTYIYHADDTFATLL
ncbi:hypothetical protein AHF37_06971 [Paragonimus kellicotti]|nr:hypothetical protein AHF37_06971 [Paragonimus kellicotti]